MGKDEMTKFKWAEYILKKNSKVGIKYKDDCLRMLYIVSDLWDKNKVSHLKAVHFNINDYKNNHKTQLSDHILTCTST